MTGYIPHHSQLGEMATMIRQPYEFWHYNDVIMSAMVSQITSLTIVYSTVYLGAYQRKHQSSASLAFVWGIHRGLVNSPHKWPVTRKIFPFDDVIIKYLIGHVAMVAMIGIINKAGTSVVKSETINLSPTTVSLTQCGLVMSYEDFVTRSRYLRQG